MYIFCVIENPLRQIYRSWRKRNLSWYFPDESVLVVIMEKFVHASVSSQLSVVKNLEILEIAYTTAYFHRNSNRRFVPIHGVSYVLSDFRYFFSTIPPHQRVNYNSTPWIWNLTQIVALADYRKSLISLSRNCKIPYHLLENKLFPSQR